MSPLVVCLRTAPLVCLLCIDCHIDCVARSVTASFYCISSWLFHHPHHSFSVIRNTMFLRVPYHCFFRCCKLGHWEIDRIHARLWRGPWDESSCAGIPNKGVLYNGYEVITAVLATFCTDIFTMRIVCLQITNTPQLNLWTKFLTHFAIFQIMK